MLGQQDQIPQLDPEAVIEKELMRRTAVVRSIAPGLSPTQALFALILANHIMQKAFGKVATKGRAGIQAILGKGKRKRK